MAANEKYIGLKIEKALGEKTGAKNPPMLNKIKGIM